MDDALTKMRDRWELVSRGPLGRYYELERMAVEGGWLYSKRVFDVSGNHRGETMTFVPGCPRPPYPDEMSFGAAVSALKLGRAVARAPWRDRGFWLELKQPPHEHPFIAMVNDQGRGAVRWQPSHQDMLTNDWVDLGAAPLPDPHPDLTKASEGDT